MSSTAYVFVDEAGNLDFSPNGTRYFVFASVSAARPFPWQTALDELRYECIEYGLNAEYFHCSADNRHVRRRVFGVLGEHLETMRTDYLVIEKRHVPKALRSASAFYAAMLGRLLRKVVLAELATGTTEIITITDTIPVGRKRRAVEKAARLTLSRTLAGRGAYRILHHSSRSHYGLQVADYCCWAAQRKWQMGEESWMSRLQPTVRSATELVAGSGCDTQ